MESLLVLAATLALAIGLAHSLLGERFIVRRLLRRTDLPHLFGSDDFTRRTLRFAWHLTTVAWWGFGVVLFGLAAGRVDPGVVVLRATAVTFAVSALLALAVTRGRHLSWVVFSAIAALAWTAA